MYYDYRPNKHVTFWFFFPYNDTEGWVSAFNHQGDWERVSIKLNSSNRATRMHYFRHGAECGLDLPWAAVSTDPQNGRPEVFIANGTHGSYASPGSHEVPCIDLPGPRDFPEDQAQRGPTRWETWKALADVKKQPWYGFGGAWGDIGESVQHDRTRRTLPGTRARYHKGGERVRSSRLPRVYRALPPPG